MDEIKIRRILDEMHEYGATVLVSYASEELTEDLILEWCDDTEEAHTCPANLAEFPLTNFTINEVRKYAKEIIVMEQVDDARRKKLTVTVELANCTHCYHRHSLIEAIYPLGNASIKGYCCCHPDYEPKIVELMKEPFTIPEGCPLRHGSCY